MKDAKDIAARVERKLLEQTSELNFVRNRLLGVAGYGIAFLTMVIEGLSQPTTLTKAIIGASILLSLLSISFAIYASYVIPLHRGMTSKFMRDLLNDDNKNDEFFTNDISVNLTCFELNTPILRRLHKLLNLGITVQAVVTLMIGITWFFNII